MQKVNWIRSQPVGFSDRFTKKEIAKLQEKYRIITSI